MPKDLSIYKVKDTSDKTHIKKELIFDLPMRIAICGRSLLSGKTNLLTNLLCREEFYLNDFEGENIYVVSESIHEDNKMKAIIKCKDIPEENLFNHYNEEELDSLFDVLEEEFIENEKAGIKNKHKLWVFDDIAHTGSLKGTNYGVLSRVLFRGRHILLSVIFLTQKYSFINTALRVNFSGLILFNTNNQELELVEADHNYLKTKKEFMDMFRNNIKENHSFLCINYSNPKAEMYLDNIFNIIK